MAVLEYVFPLPLPLVLPFFIGRQQLDLLLNVAAICAEIRLLVSHKKYSAAGFLDGIASTSLVAASNITYSLFK